MPERLWFEFMESRARGLQKCLSCPERRYPCVWTVVGFPQIKFCFPECAVHSAKSIGISLLGGESSTLEHGKEHVKVLHRRKKPFE